MCIKDRASIAAVAQVELRTRMEGEELGTMLTISGSKVEGQEAVSCPKGNTVKQKRTLHNPVREPQEMEYSDSRCIFDMLSILAQARSYGQRNTFKKLSKTINLFFTKGRFLTRIFHKRSPSDFPV